MSYPYQPLVGLGDFRILELSPGHFEDDIHCDLRIISFQQVSKYEAVSYVWGKSHTQKRILVNGFDFAITPNLDTALRYFRNSIGSRVLWVDSVCINQRDEVERSQQVSIMDEIYQRCEHVLVWLGMPTREPFRQPKLVAWWFKSTFHLSSWNKDRQAITPAAQIGTAPKASYSFGSAVDVHNPFILAQHFANDGHLYDLPGFRDMYDLRGQRTIFSPTESFLLLWQDFLNGLRSPWWTRIWCVQEALLPFPSRVIVHFGHFSINWIDLKAAAVNHRKHLFGCCEQAGKLLPLKYHATIDAMLMPQLSVFTTGGSSSFHLDALLRMYRHKDCHDPRDKVFGLLGLAKRTCSRCDILPDYSQDIGTVFTMTMQEIIRQNPKELSFLTGDGFHSSKHGLPSWVRDFSQRLTASDVRLDMDRLNTYFLYNASANLRNIDVDKFHKLQIFGTTRMLGVNGVCVGSVARLGAVTPENKDWKELGKLLENWHRVGNIRPFQEETISKSSLHFSFWRTVIGDIVHEGRLAPEDSPVDEGRIFRRFRSETDTNQYDSWLYECLRTWKRQRLYFSARKMPLDNTFVESFLCATHRRRFFLAQLNEDGKATSSRSRQTRDHGTQRYGLCNADTLAGDQIWILAGGRMPFILRPIRCSSSNLSGGAPDPAIALGKDSCGPLPSYSFIGDCYLHGAMDGELVQNDSIVRQIWLA